jgi:hypothetical protein
VTVTLAPDADADGDGDGDGDEDGGGKKSMLVVDPSRIVFTNRTWNVAVPVQVAALNDTVAQDATAAHSIAHVAASTDRFYDKAGAAFSPASGSVAVVVLDSTVPGARLTPSSLVVTEGAAGGGAGGGAYTYTLSLTREPTAPVFVRMYGMVRFACTPSVLVFGPGNYSEPQVVTITVDTDDVSHADHTAFLGHAFDSADARYNTTDAGAGAGAGAVEVAGAQLGQKPLLNSALPVTVRDDDFARVNITSSAVALRVAENGGGGGASSHPAAATYKIVLTSEPEANVTVQAVYGGTDLIVTPASMLFTRGNWDSPVTVVVTAVADDISTEGGVIVAIDGSGSSSWREPHVIAHTVTSLDPMYDDDAAMAMASSSSLFVGGGRNVSVIVDDSAGTLGFASTSLAVDEAVGDAVVTVTRVAGMRGEVSVSYSTSDWTASAGKEYMAAAGTLVLAENQTTGIIRVRILNNSDYDDGATTKAFNVTLSGASHGALLVGGSASVTTTVRIGDDGDAGRLAFSRAGYKFDEITGVVNVTVTRAGGASGQVTVNYAASDGTAKGGGADADAGIDYISTEGVLTFPDGETSASFTVSLVDNANYAAPFKYLVVTLALPTGGATLGEPAIANVTVVDDGDAGVLRFANATQSVSEGVASGSALVTVLRVGGTSGEVSAAYRTLGNGNSGNDTATGSDSFDCSDGSLDSKSGEKRSYPRTHSPTHSLNYPPTN